MNRWLYSLILICFFVSVVLCAFDIAYEYGEKAFKRCRAHGRKIPKEICSRIQDIVEDYVETIGSQLVGLVDYPMKVAERNSKHPAFIRAGNRLLDQVIETVLENPKATDEEIKGKLFTPFFKWWMDLLKNEPPLEFIPNFPPGFQMPSRPPHFPHPPPPPQTTPQSTESSTSQSTESSTPQSTPQSTESSTPQSTPQSTESSTSQSTESSTPQSIESSTPQSAQIEQTVTSQTPQIKEEEEIV